MLFKQYIIRILMLFVLSMSSFATTCTFAQDDLGYIRVISEKANSRYALMQSYDSVWSVNSIVKMEGLPGDQVEKIYVQTHNNTTRRIAKDGVTDQKLISKYYDEDKKFAEVFVKKGEFRSKYEINMFIGIDGTYFDGVQVDPVSQMSRQVSEIYGDKWRMYYNGNAKSGNGEDVAIDHPKLFGTSVNSIYMLGTLDGFALMPYDLYLMTGYNPLKLLDGKWKLIRANSSECTFENKFAYTSSGAYDQVLITLDSKHDFLPKFISSKGHDISYKILDYKKNNGVWIVSEYERAWIAGQKTDIQRYKLKTSALHTGKKTGISELLGKYRGEILDTRLAGINIEYTDLIKVLSDESKMINYQWVGRVPDVEQLRKIRSKSDFTNPSKSPIARLFLFVPGVLLIATGVFLKLRKSRKEKEASTSTAKK